MFGVSRSGRKVRVAHDVRIDVMRPTDVDKLHEPLCPEPDVGAHFISAYRASSGQRASGQYLAPLSTKTPHYRGEATSTLRRTCTAREQQRQTSTIH
jgi:hypothetical protein